MTRISLSRSRLDIVWPVAVFTVMSKPGVT